MTKGQFFKVKVLHVIALTFLFYYYSSGFTWTVWILRHSDEFNKLYNTDISFIPTIMVRLGLILHNALAAIITLSAFGLLSRNQIARKTLLSVLPIIVFPSTIIMFMGFQPKVQTFMSDLASLVICFILCVILNVWIFIIYRSKSMTEFMDNKRKNE